MAHYITRTIRFTSGKELERVRNEETVREQEAEKVATKTKPRYYFVPKAREEFQEVYGTRKDIEREIAFIKLYGGVVHGIMLKEDCEHCNGRGTVELRDVSFSVWETV